MKYVAETYKGVSLTLGEEFDLNGFKELLKNEKVSSLALGKVSTLKSNIRFVYPVYVEGEVPEGEKLLIHLNGGAKPVVAYAVDYDSLDVTNQYNDAKNSFLLIGDTLISRNEYSLVMPAPAEEEEAPQEV